MMEYRVYIIETESQFYTYLPELKSAALKKKSPRTYEVGFDLEYICKANHPESYSKSSQWVESNDSDIIACLIQIASSGVCLLINLVKLGPFLPKKLIKIIQNDNWIKYGVGVERDLDIVSNNYKLGHCGSGIDLKTLALLNGLNTPNMKYMANTYLGIKMNKSKNKSICNWSKPLENKEYTYAANDAIISYLLGKKIVKIDLNYSSSKSSRLELNFKNVSPELHSQKLTNSQDSRLRPINSQSNSGSHQHPQKYIKKNNIKNLNYIGVLQEYAQQKYISAPEYTYKLTSKGFKVTCTFCGNYTEGLWVNKKQAKTIAAGKMHQLIFDEIYTPEFNQNDTTNHIGKLQEYAQQSQHNLPVYLETYSNGEFKVKCSFLNLKGTGKGTNKKSAKKMPLKSYISNCYPKI